MTTHPYTKTETQIREASNTIVQKVAILGGGIGGLATAIALRKKGIDAQVYEQARSLRPIGAHLALFPNGFKILAALSPGIVEALKRAGSQSRILNLRRSTGETILAKPFTLIEQYGYPILNIRWLCLQEILASALPPDIIHLNHRCIDFKQNDSGVEAYFDGGKTVQVDLLIGADGINSVVRQTLTGEGSPRYAGRMSWRCVLKYSHDLLRPDEITVMTASEGKTFVFGDAGNGYIFWSGGSLSEDKSLSETATKVKIRVLKEFGDWGEPVQEILKATDAEAIVERPISDRPPLSSWSKGRVTLLGDAAHPMVPSLGQGANMAFEDAYELSQCLAHAPSIETALASYEKSRIERTQVIQARSALQGNRAYEADSESYLSAIAERAKMGNDEFEQWLYRYEPLA